LSDWLWRTAQEISGVSDFLFHEALYEQSLDADKVRYLKRDFVFREGFWRRSLQTPLVGQDKAERVVVGHSDIPTGLRDLLRIRARTKGELFCSNLTAPRLFASFLGAHPLPLGLTNPTAETSLHSVLGNFRHITAVVSEVDDPDREIRIYANFDPSTAPQHRERVAQLCSTIPSIVVGTTEMSEEGRVQYLREMRDCRLVVCPRGNGLDTHRFWEALYVGAIPIVLRNSYQARVARRYGLPYVGLGSWESLRNITRIVSQADTILSSEPRNMDAARLSYWKNRIFGD